MRATTGILFAALTLLLSLAACSGGGGGSSSSFSPGFMDNNGDGIYDP
jgi:hypothetical protein